MSFAQNVRLFALTAVAAAAPLAAQANVPQSTFQFYLDGPVFDHVLPSASYSAGDLGLTVRAYSASGKLVSVSERWDGLGVVSGLLEPGELNSSLLNNPGDYLVLSFNQTVRLTDLRFSWWENGLLGDHATLKWGNSSLSLNDSLTNSHGLDTFSLSSNVVGNTFKIQAVGALTAFRLAGINAIGVIPEPASYALMGLGLVGLALVSRQRQA